MVKTDLLLRHPRLLTLVNILLSFALLLFLLIFTRDIFSRAFRKIEKQPRPAPVVAQQTKKNLSDFEGIFRHNPFGFPGGQLQPLSVSREGPAAPSDITLVGTVSGPPDRSYAIFVDKSGKQEVFRVGDPVFSVGKLKRIEKEKAFISDKGREIKIPMTELLTVKEVNPSDGSVAAGDFARSAGRGTFIVDQRKISYALENPNQLMTDARLQPNISNGKQEGFVLKEVRNGGIYQSLGLQNGDVLLRINDYGISNPESALQAFTALRGMDRVQVDIMRGGSKMTLTYQIR